MLEKGIIQTNQGFLILEAPLHPGGCLGVSRRGEGPTALQQRQEPLQNYADRCGMSSSQYEHPETKATRLHIIIGLLLQLWTCFEYISSNHTL